MRKRKEIDWCGAIESHAGKNGADDTGVGHDGGASTLNFVGDFADRVLHAREEVAKLLATWSGKRWIFVQPALRKGRITSRCLPPGKPLPFTKSQLPQITTTQNRKTMGSGNGLRCFACSAKIAAVNGGETVATQAADELFQMRPSYRVQRRIQVPAESARQVGMLVTNQHQF